MSRNWIAVPAFSLVFGAVCLAQVAPVGKLTSVRSWGSKNSFRISGPSWGLPFLPPHQGFARRYLTGLSPFGERGFGRRVAPRFGGWGSKWPIFQSCRPDWIPNTNPASRFTEEWSRRAEAELPSIGSGILKNSPLLKEDMTMENVILLIGSPSSSIQSGSQETWRYSAYSVVFDQGLLKDLR